MILYFPIFWTIISIKGPAAHVLSFWVPFIHPSRNFSPEKLKIITWIMCWKRDIFSSKSLVRTFPFKLPVGFLGFSLEEDFVSWREQFWPAVCEHFGVEASGDESRCVHGQIVFVICSFHFFHYCSPELYFSHTWYWVCFFLCVWWADIQSPVFLPCSIRQYELKVHTDVNMNKVYTGEIGRLKSFEVQKP